MMSASLFFGLFEFQLQSWRCQLDCDVVFAGNHDGRCGACHRCDMAADVALRHPADGRTQYACQGEQLWPMDILGLICVRHDMWGWTLWL